MSAERYAKRVLCLARVGDAQRMDHRVSGAAGLERQGGSNDQAVGGAGERPGGEVRASNGQVLESDVWLDQGGPVEEVDRSPCSFFLDQDPIRFLEVGLSGCRIGLVELQVHQLPVASVVPARISTYQHIGMKRVVQQVAGVRIVDDPSHAEGVGAFFRGAAARAEPVQVLAPFRVGRGHRDAQVVPQLLGDRFDEVLVAKVGPQLDAGEPCSTGIPCLCQIDPGLGRIEGVSHCPALVFRQLRRDDAGRRLPPGQAEQVVQDVLAVYGRGQGLAHTGVVRGRPPGVHPQVVDTRVGRSVELGAQHGVGQDVRRLAVEGHTGVDQVFLVGRQLFFPGDDRHEHLFDGDVRCAVVEGIGVEHQPVAVAPFGEHVGTVPDKVSGFCPVWVAGDEVQARGVGGRGGHDGGEEGCPGVKGEPDGPCVQGGDADPVRVSEHTVFVVLGSLEVVHQGVKVGLQVGVEQAEDAVDIVLGGHWLAVGPDSAGAQGDGVDPPIGGDGVGRRPGRFDAPIGPVAVQGLHQLAEDEGD